MQNNGAPILLHVLKLSLIIQIEHTQFAEVHRQMFVMATRLRSRFDVRAAGKSSVFALKQCK